MDPRRISLIIFGFAVVAVAIGVYIYASNSYMQKSGSAPLTDFTGTIVAKSNNTITVERLIPPANRETASTDTEKIVITKNTVLIYLEMNPEFEEFRKKINPLRAGEAISLLPSSTTSILSTPKLFIETTMTAEQLVVGAKVFVRVIEDAQIRKTLTAKEIRLFPDSFVIDPFSNPPVSAQTN